ncbi:odorant receptor 85c [Tribolium castaneum]|uniref:Odorant receptor n=1 Tax=Tribolium castaneum TaxID=7070 RepID=C0Z3S0_TRICA|nr:PREDICTED: odorant receptor 85c [Tribolium castaneum]EFA10703.1 odorant receptor [Tribolium castaneum]CAM84021.1 olfactory receptor 23 [Tribolium castaneum]|eukprot:XP_001814862.1 PREDICTED: odorant receptor 85c [Tribolium castaneum]
MAKDTSPVLRESIEVMKYLQLWPQNERTNLRRRYFIVIFLCSPLHLGLATHLVVCLKDNLDVDLSANIAVLSAVTGLTYMLIVFVWSQDKLVHLLAKLDTHEIFGTPDNLTKRSRRLNFYAKLYSYYCYFGIVIYSLVQIIEMPQCRKMNEEKGLSEICGMIVPFWAPFDIDWFPLKQIFWLNQLLGIYIIIKGGAAVSITTFEVAQYICLKIKHLNRLLREAFDDPCDVVVEQKLLHCIRYQQHIIRTNELFNVCFKHCNGCYVVMVGIIIASLLNQILKEKSVGALVHFAGWICSFFICCHAGQAVISESLTIPEAALDSHWYEAPVKYKKVLLLLLVRSQKAFNLQATPIGIMSFDLFIALLKTSYSYFTLLHKST